MIEEYEEYKKISSDIIYINKENCKNLHFIRPKWRKVIYKLDEYDKNIISSILEDKAYQFSINLSDIFNLIPMSEKKVKSYDSLTNYLKSLGINMTIVSNSNYKGRKKKRD